MSTTPTAPGPDRRTYQDGVRRVAARGMNHLGETSLTPDALTVVGVLLCAAGAVLVWLEYHGWVFFLAGAAAFVVGSVLDILDGALARTSGKGTPFGAFLDSTVDRVGEAFMLGAIALVLMRQQNEWGVGLTFGALAGSFLVSYTRARAEAIGLRGDVGLGSRAERVVVITTGLVLAPLHEYVLPAAIILLAATAWMTVVQRVLAVRSQLRERI
ncbi:MAG: CDP-alcohol phosphatidyltransferase family protein [Actinobacteria bacterium]|nr:CDP-alcohol phosphatidyltransferase family protein [Actinomycetota bacterium]